METILFFDWNDSLFLDSINRIVDCISKKKVADINFISYGAHIDKYPTAYLTCAVAMGMTKNEVDTFFERIRKIMKSKTFLTAIPLKNEPEKAELAKMPIQSDSKLNEILTLTTESPVPKQQDPENAGKLSSSQGLQEQPKVEQTQAKNTKLQQNETNSKESNENSKKKKRATKKS